MSYTLENQTLEARPHEIQTVGWHDTALRPQWVRYLIAGTIAAGVDFAVFHSLAVYIFPCVDASLGESIRSNRFMIDKTIAFLIANVSSYGMNSRWVFMPGRHPKLAEIALFFGASLLSYGCGMQIGRFLIGSYGASSHVAAIACIGLATVMNFTIRKTLVFRKSKSIGVRCRIDAWSEQPIHHR